MCMFIVSHATICFCMFLVGYPQTPEPVIPRVDWHKLTYLVLTCRETPINQSIFESFHTNWLIQSNWLTLVVFEPFHTNWLIQSNWLALIVSESFHANWLSTNFVCKLSVFQWSAYSCTLNWLGCCTEMHSVTCVADTPLVLGELDGSDQTFICWSYT